MSGNGPKGAMHAWKRYVVLRNVREKLREKLRAVPFCDGTRRYGVPGNENDESIFFMSVLY